MAVPTTRQEFIDYCLRNLGAPVLQINVQTNTDTNDMNNQVDDRIDEALNFFTDFHYDGTEAKYYVYQVTQQDIDNKYITLPDNFMGAVRVFPVDLEMSTNNMFSLHYQIILNDLHNLTSVSMVPYYMALQRLDFLEQILVGEKPIRYNRISNRVYFDMNWDGITPGIFLCVEAYCVIDPEEYPRLWSNRWLQKYATALIKKQYGMNTKKYGEMKLPGGLVFNGQALYNEAVEEIKELEEECRNEYFTPLGVYSG